MNQELLKTADKFRDKLEPIKVLLTDVDGILTDGRVYYAGEKIGFNRFFHVRDGYGLKILQRAGIKVGLISGGNSPGLEARAEALGIDYFYPGVEDKRASYLDVLSKGYKDHEIIYLGDELFDIPLLKRVGFSVTVQNASLEVKEVVDYISEVPPGYGVVRETVDMLRHIQGIQVEIPDFE